MKENGWFRILDCGSGFWKDEVLYLDKVSVSLIGTRQVELVLSPTKCGYSYSCENTPKIIVTPLERPLLAGITNQIRHLQTLLSTISAANHEIKDLATVVDLLRS